MGLTRARVYQLLNEINDILKSLVVQDFDGGTISADLVGAQKVLNPPVPISIGNQTVSIGNLNKIMPLPAPQAQPPLPPLPPPVPTTPPCPAVPEPPAPWSTHSFDLQARVSLQVPFP